MLAESLASSARWMEEWSAGVEEQMRRKHTAQVHPRPDQEGRDCVIVTVTTVL